jgi:hypothetical protein
VLHSLPRVEIEVNNGDCIAFQVDAGVDWNLAVVRPLFHKGKDLPLTHVNRLSPQPVENMPICLVDGYLPGHLRNP